MNSKSGSSRIAFGLTAAAFSVATVPTSACPPRYTIEAFDGADCGPSDPSLIYPAAINASGVIVGDYYPCVLGNSKAFKWSGGPSITLIPMPLGTVASSAFDIADDGAIVGDYATGAGFGGGFLRIGNFTNEIGVPDGAVYAKPTGVNSAHQVVGQYAIAPDQEPLAFLWENGRFYDLTADTGFPFATASAISENGLVTGDTGANQLGAVFPYIWDRGTVTILDVPDGGVVATGYDVTSNGLVCGETYYLDDPPGSGFYTVGTVWSEGSATVVGTLPGDVWSRLYSINATGDAVGVSDNNQVGRPILWHDGTLYNIKELLVDPDSVTQLGANAINDAGQIAAVVMVPRGGGGWYGARLNPVPPKVGDTDCNFVVNVDDLLGVIKTWGPCGKASNCGTDLNTDKVVNVQDLMMVLKNWDF